MSWHDEVNGEGGGTAAAAHVPLHRLNKTTQNNTKTPTHSHVCTVHPTGGDSLVLAELSEFMEAVGEADPMAKIYVTTKKLDNLATYAFFTTLAQVCAFVRACVCVRACACVCVRAFLLLPLCPKPCKSPTPHPAAHPTLSTLQLDRLTFSRSIGSLVAKKPVRHPCSCNHTWLLLLLLLVVVVVVAAVVDADRLLSVRALIMWVLIACRHVVCHLRLHLPLRRWQQGDPIDGPAFVCGMLTLLKQFHTTHTHTFLQMAGQYVRSHVVVPTKAEKVTAP